MKGFLDDYNFPENSSHSSCHLNSYFSTRPQSSPSPTPSISTISEEDISSNTDQLAEALAINYGLMGLKFKVPVFRRREENDIVVSKDSAIEGWIEERRICKVTGKSLTDAKGNPKDKFLFFRDSESIARYRRTEAIRKLQIQAYEYGANAILNLTTYYDKKAVCHVEGDAYVLIPTSHSPELSRFSLQPSTTSSRRHSRIGADS